MRFIKQRDKEVEQRDKAIEQREYREKELNIFNDLYKQNTCHNSHTKNAYIISVPNSCDLDHIPHKLNKMYMIHSSFAY